MSVLRVFHGFLFSISNVGSNNDIINEPFIGSSFGSQMLALIMTDAAPIMDLIEQRREALRITAIDAHDPSRDDKYELEEHRFA